MGQIIYVCVRDLLKGFSVGIQVNTRAVLNVLKHANGRGAATLERSES